MIISGLIGNIAGASSNDARTILNGVNTLKFVKSLDTFSIKLSVFGSNAMVLASAYSGDQTEGASPIVASTTTASGSKIVVFGYTSFLRSEFMFYSSSYKMSTHL